MYAMTTVKSSFVDLPPRMVFIKSHFRLYDGEVALYSDIL